VHAAPNTASHNRQAAEVAAALVEEMFVFPDQAKKIADDLRKRAASGAFDTIENDPDLAAALTKALQAAEDDKHLGVRYNSEAGAQPLLTVAEALARLQKMRTGGRNGDGLGDAEMQRRQNYGIRTVDILPGNIGYLRIDTFYDISVARQTYDAALRFLGNTEGMIVDLRTNRGGANSSVAYLASHFLPVDHGVLNTMRARGVDEVDVSSVVPTPTRHFEKVPLYILTSYDTFSAGEAFSYILQQFGRALTVGETTKGGGRPNAFMPLGAGLSLSVSVGAVEHPRTKTSWQGVGVIADLKAPVKEALEVAQKALREKLSGVKVATAATTAPALPPHLESLLAALNGTPEALEEYATRHYTAAYRNSRTAEQRAQTLTRLRGDFGRFVVTEITESTDERTALRVIGTTGKGGVILVEHEPAPSHAIAGLQFQVER
jgi:hypothetical protein